MAIDVTCSCGKVMQAKDDQAGRRAQCSGCGSVVRIPGTKVSVGTSSSASPVDDDQSFTNDVLSRMLRNEFQYHQAARAAQDETLAAVKGIALDVKRLTMIANVFFYVWLVIPGIGLAVWLLVMLLRP